MTLFDKLATNFLHLSYIGTFAKVYINDQLVASIDNLYRDYYINVGRYTVIGANTLRIDIESTVRKTFELKAAYRQ